MSYSGGQPIGDGPRRHYRNENAMSTVKVPKAVITLAAIVAFVMQPFKVSKDAPVPKELDTNPAKTGLGHGPTMIPTALTDELRKVLPDDVFRTLFHFIAGITLREHCWQDAHDAAPKTYTTHRRHGTLRTRLGLQPDEAIPGLLTRTPCAPCSVANTKNQAAGKAEKAAARKAIDEMRALRSKATEAALTAARQARRAWRAWERLGDADANKPNAPKPDAFDSEAMIERIEDAEQPMRVWFTADWHVRLAPPTDLDTGPVADGMAVELGIAQRDIGIVLFDTEHKPSPEDGHYGALKVMS